MNDIINGLFQIGSGLFVLNHCRVLFRDKQVKGVSVVSTAFFFLFGLWNMYYFPSLGQDFSFYAGVLVTLANSLWLSLMIKYKDK